MGDCDVVLPLAFGKSYDKAKEKATSPKRTPSKGGITFSKGYRGLLVSLAFMGAFCLVDIGEAVLFSNSNKDGLDDKVNDLFDLMQVCPTTLDIMHAYQTQTHFPCYLISPRPTQEVLVALGMRPLLMLIM